MAVDIFLSVGFRNIAADLFPAVVVLIYRLADQVQTMELMKHLDTSTVAPFPRYWMLDLQRVWREA